MKKEQTQGQNAAAQTRIEQTCARTGLKTVRMKKEIQGRKGEPR